jgi:preprotein translocase subunit SecA
MKTIFPSFSDNFIKKANTIVKKVNAYEAEVSALSDADFPIKTQELKDKIAAGTPIDSLVPYAFALVREAAKRTLGQRHYDVQIIGGYALHSGHIAEMRTGEGKTLVGTLPIYMNALSGRGVHVVTVNDYLARRDAVWMGQVYAFLGLSIGESAIATNSYQSYYYASNALKGEFPEGEPAIAEDKLYSRLYTRFVLKRDFYLDNKLICEL